MFVIMNFMSLRNTTSINKSDKCQISVDNNGWDNYYKEQINKSNNHTLNKVSDFTGNQTGGFIRPLGNFLWDQNKKFKKWLHPEHYQRVVEENKEEKKGSTRIRK